MPEPVKLSYTPVSNVAIHADNQPDKHAAHAAVQVASHAVKRATGCARVYLIAIFALLILPALPASADSVNSVDITTLIHKDGSASIIEIWDIDVDDAAETEWYMAKHNLDDMDIKDLNVQENIDGGAVAFETLAAWDEKAARDAKAQKCGLLKTKGGYEICWGIGEIGHHIYTLGYTITNMVKGYQGGDAMRFNFLSDVSGGLDKLVISLGADDFAFVNPATRIWATGYSAIVKFAGGGAVDFSGGGGAGGR